MGCLYRNLHSFTSFNSALCADPLLLLGKARSLPVYKDNDCLCDEKI
ncbi:hypothetical protein AH4AK4_1904 [Aeromonas hydrophila 4AK4]|nr:hypothetical protein AH4AK4_1904 [Aeromonas hydrophila 4AK4]